MSWDALAEEIRTCVRCPELALTRRTVVVGQWPPGARLLLVGEAPGAEEDLAGEPFVGRSGTLLNGFLAEAGLVREEIAVVNVLRCRPPGNRPPRPEEVAHCTDWLTAQRSLIAPRLTLALGKTAAVTLLGRLKTLAGARGVVHPTVLGDVVATYHPSAAMRFGPTGGPALGLREDLGMVAELLRSAGAGP